MLYRKFQPGQEFRYHGVRIVITEVRCGKVSIGFEPAPNDEGCSESSVDTPAEAGDKDG